MTCRICDTVSAKSHLMGRDVWRQTDERHAYTECGFCGCIQINQYPDDMSKYYATNYYSFNVINHKVSRLKKFLIHLRDRYAISGRGLWGKFLFSRYPTKQFSSLSLPNIAKDKSILDVGCGDGSLLRDLSRHGYTRLLGIDPFGQDDCSNPGYELRKCDIFEINQTFDIVIMKGTLEHQPNQINLLKKTHSLLKSGGRCIIRIPICDSYAYEQYGTDWVQFDAPRHFYLHTKKSMQVLAEKTNFDLVNIWDDSEFLQVIGSEQLQKEVYLGDAASIIPSGKTDLFDPAQMSQFRVLYEKIQKDQTGDTYIFDFLKKS